MKTVLIAGATGYLGRHLVRTYVERRWHVRALVRDARRAEASGLIAHELIEAEATRPDTLAGVMQGVDLVVSSLGITRQKDGLSYRDVDYQANRNLLDRALEAGVDRFAYIHVLGAESMGHVPLVAAKQAFVDDLQAAHIASTLVAPSGYFSDMADFLNMARAGRVWLFGRGAHRLNPIHGADLAEAVAEAVAAERPWLDVGGPDVLSQNDLARLAFESLGKEPRITHLPDALRRLALAVLPRVTPRHIHGPAQFFLTAMGRDMVGTPCGTRHLIDHFRAAAKTG